MFQSASGEVGEAVKYAIDIGYRHIDCAWYYKNEAQVGEALNQKLKEGAVKREEMFITTKVRKLKINFLIYLFKYIFFWNYTISNYFSSKKYLNTAQKVYLKLKVLKENLRF